jgi:hypothetical protein
VTTPTWQAASSGQLPKTAQVNQLLGPHQAQILYPSLRKANQSTAGAGSVNTDGTYLAQSFTTASGQTQVGYVRLTISTTGGLTGLLPPTTVSLYASSGTAPTGSALGTVHLTAEYVASSPAIVSIPLPVTGLTASTSYWLVMASAGDASHFFNWFKSNQVSGASTSPDGSTWTAQAYGLLYEVWDQTIASSATQPIFTWEDDGAAWTWLDYNGDGTLNIIAEYTTGQTSTTYTQSYRTLAYSNFTLTAVT